MGGDDLQGIEEASAKIRAARLAREQAERDRKDREAQVLSRDAAALASWRAEAVPLFERVLAAVGEKIDPSDVKFGLKREDEGRAHPSVAFNFASPVAGRQTALIRQFELVSRGQVRTNEAHVSPDGRKAETGPHSNVAPVDGLTESQVLKLVRQSFLRFADLDAS